MGLAWWVLRMYAANPFSKDQHMWTTNSQAWKLAQLLWHSSTACNTQKAPTGWYQPVLATLSISLLTIDHPFATLSAELKVTGRQVLSIHKHGHWQHGILKCLDNFGLLAPWGLEAPNYQEVFA